MCYIIQIIHRSTDLSRLRSPHSVWTQALFLSPGPECSYKRGSRHDQALQLLLGDSCLLGLPVSQDFWSHLLVQEFIRHLCFFFTFASLSAHTAYILRLDCSELCQNRAVRALCRGNHRVPAAVGLWLIWQLCGGSGRSLMVDVMPEVESQN